MRSTHVAAPMFHALGFAETIVAIGLGSTVIVERRFKPERALESVARHGATALIVVPVMLQRIVNLLEAEPGRYDTSSLRIVLVAGAQLEAELVAARAARSRRQDLQLLRLDRGGLGHVRHPGGSARGAGLRGRAPFGTVVRLFDTEGQAVEGPGRTGRIFVGNGFQFEGYTGGGNKELIDGLMSTGDVGHFDADGRLFVDGRDDDMIVSGGENLFPGEVEELLITHPAVEEAAVIGVDDAEFGKRLAAFVVLRPGATMSEDEVREFVKRNLARYKVPRDVAFIDELPRNPTGKVLKRDLRAQYASG